jgi:hypothetical protein
LRIGDGPLLERVWSFRSIKVRQTCKMLAHLSSQTCTLCLQQSRYNLQAEMLFMGQL